MEFSDGDLIMRITQTDLNRYEVLALGESGNYEIERCSYDDLKLAFKHVVKGIYNDYEHMPTEEFVKQFLSM